MRFKTGIFYSKILMLWLIVWAQFGNAQITVVLDTSEYTHFKDFHQDNYNSRNALPQNTIKATYRDKSGLLWVVTEKGISSFDGTRFVHFVSREISNANFRVQFFHSYEDTIFLGYKMPYQIVDGRISPSKWTQSSPYFLGKQGAFLASSEHLDFEKLRKESPLFDQWLENKHMHQRFKCFGDTALLLEHENYKFQYFENNKLIASYTRNHNSGEGLFTAKVGPYVLIMEEGKNQFEVLERGSLKEIVEFDLLPMGARILEADNKDVVYVLHGDRDLYTLEAQGDTLLFRLKVKGLTMPCITSIDIMDHGGYYVGTCSKGLFKLRKKRSFRTRSTDTSVTDGAIYDVVYGHVNLGKDTMVIAPGLAISESGQRMISGILELHLRRRHIFLDSRDILWAIGWGDLGYRIDLGLHPPTVDTLARGYGNFEEDDNGNIWALANDSLWVLKEGRWTGFHLNERYDNNVVRLIHDPYLNQLWLLHESGGLSRFDPSTGTTTVIEAAAPYQIGNVYPDSTGFTWMNTYSSGLLALEGDKLIKLALDKKKYLLNSHCILEDSTGFFWISSNHGMFRVLKEELIANARGITPGVYYHRYGESDGLVNHEFNGRCTPCAVKMSNGNFSFPSLEGLVDFNPYTIGSESQQSSLRLVRVLIDGEEFLPGEIDKLDQDFERLEFIVQSPYDGYDDNVYVDFRLKGSKEWREVFEDNSLIFGKLEPGKYELQLRRKLGFGIDNYEYDSLSFYIRPYYYQTITFRVVIAFLLATIVLLIFRWRSLDARRRRRVLEDIIEKKTGEYRTLNETLKLNLARLRRARAEQEATMQTKDRLLGLYTHDIRGPLRFIMSMIDNSDDLRDIKPEEIEERFQVIRNSTKGVFMRTERMFSWIQMQEDGFEIQLVEVSLLEMVEHVIANYRDQAREKGISLVNKVRTGRMIQTEKNIVSIIINNVVDNAVKFTKEGTIEFEVYQVEMYHMLIISDTGVGIPPDKIEKIRAGVGQGISSPGTNKEEGKGYGLRAIAELLDKVEGYMEIESEVGRGTTVSIFFKDLRK